VRLPLFLAGVAIAALAVLAFGPRIASAPTRAVARPTREALPTPSPAPTAAPTASLPTTVSRPRTGGITYILSHLEHIQAAADAGDPRYLYYRDPVKVTLRDLPLYGFAPGPITIVSPNPPEPAPTSHTNEHGLPETDVVVRYRGREYWIVLDQFVRRGPSGIWSIMTITPM
jgi:hypothetical protein